ncbi:MAG TPA: ElyC/SanA/YdcF family protein [Candidatus Acidoferrum sp.]|jgi:uncharacterized SAM-binding protein YcdF (DUF218 family)
MRRTGRWFIAIVALLLMLAAICFLGVGRWLVVQDPLEKAQAIVVLSGRMPIRALEAAKLYREGYAPEIWLTRPLEPAASMHSLGVEYEGEDFYNTRVLVHEGVPESAIRVLTPPIENTADEIRAIAAQMASPNSPTTLRAPVIIVTTKAHTRRVRALWRALAAKRGRAIVRAAEDDPFDAARWWRDTSDALDVLREVLGLLNAWAGLPLRPAT